MSFSSFKKVFSGLFPKKDTDSRTAYDLWADTYDNQPGNLMLDLDEQVFSELLKAVDINGKQVADIGCGTGRHWPKIMDQNPARLVGFDVSEGMLNKLKKKFPGADTHLLGNENKLDLPGNSMDFLFSTLTVAHIPDFRSVLMEWIRVIKTGGDLIFTDYHPMILDKGGKRTFQHGGKYIAIENIVYPIELIRNLAPHIGLKEVHFIEKMVDESVRDYYDNGNALKVYETYKGLPVIYGIHFKKEK